MQEITSVTRLTARTTPLWRECEERHSVFTMGMGSMMPVIQIRDHRFQVCVEHNEKGKPGKILFIHSNSQEVTSLPAYQKGEYTGLVTSQFKKLPRHSIPFLVVFREDYCDRYFVELDPNGHPIAVFYQGFKL